MGRAESRLRPVDRSLGGSGGAPQRCAEAERSAWHRDRAAPNFFSTHLSAMLTKTEQKFYFSSPSSCTTPSPFSTPLGTPLGGSLPEFWTTGHVLGLDAPSFFHLDSQTCLIHISCYGGINYRRAGNYSVKRSLWTFPPVRRLGVIAVSYTHLTLPTILRV